MKFSQVVSTTLLAVAVCVATDSLAYQHNYTCRPEQSDCEDGQQPTPIVWEQACVPFYLDKDGSSDFPKDEQGLPSQTLRNIVQRSFGAWNQPDCSGLRLQYAGLIDPARARRPDQKNRVSFADSSWTQQSATTFATTVVNYNPRTGAIRDAHITVNDQFYRFSATGAPGPGEADLQNTLTHEAGHFIGMAHSRVAAATMFGSATLGETKKRTLARDDIRGLCDAYPAAEYLASCSDQPADDPGSDDGSDAFGWGKDDAPAEQSACSVTGVGTSATLPPLILIVGLIGGVSCRRLRKRCSDG